MVQWNETIKLFRGGMPLRRHWAHFRYYDYSFTGSEAVDFLHDLLRRNYNFGPDVTRYQTLQLLKKFFKAHVIEDIKGRHGTEDFEDNGHLYRCFDIKSTSRHRCSPLNVFFHIGDAHFFSLQVSFTVSSKVFSNTASVERQQ